MIRKLMAFMVRGLRADTRAAFPYILRSVILGGFLLILFILLNEAGYSSTNSSGRKIYWFIFYTVLVSLHFVGIPHFCTCITEERDEDTLGLLIMTGMNPISILVGKLIPRLISTLMIFFTLAPLFYLCIAFGGVGASDIGLSLSCLTAFVVMVSGMGVMTSVLCKRGRTAIALMFLMMAALYLTPPLLNGFHSILQEHPTYTMPPALDHWLLMTMGFIYQFNPFLQVSQAQMIGAGPDVFWLNGHTSQAVLGVISFMLAWLLFRRRTKDGGVSVPEGGRIRLSFGGKKNHRTLFPPPRAWSPRAITWKDAYYKSSAFTSSLLRMVIVLLLLWMITQFLFSLSRSFGTNNNVINLRDFWQIMGLLLFYAVIFFFFAGFCTFSEMGFRREFSERTWSSLVGLPLSIQQVYLQKWKGWLFTQKTKGWILFLSFLMAGDLMMEVLGELVDIRLDHNLVLPFLMVVIIQFILGSILTTHVATFFRWGSALLVGATMLFIDFIIVVSFISNFHSESDAVALFLLMAFVSALCIIPAFKTLMSRLALKACE